LRFASVIYLTFPLLNTAIPKQYPAMTRSIYRVLQQAAVLPLVLFTFPGVSHAIDDSPKMAKPFVQKNRVRKKVTVTPAPAVKPLATTAPMTEPTIVPEPTAAPVSATAAPRTATQKRVATPRPQRVARPSSQQAPSASSASSSGAVDLSTLTASDSSSGSSSAGSSVRGSSVSKMQKTPHATSGVFPNFKFYFDFLLKYAPGVDQQSAFAFDSFHLFKVSAFETPRS